MKKVPWLPAADVDGCHYTNLHQSSKFSRSLKMRASNCGQLQTATYERVRLAASIITGSRMQTEQNLPCSSASSKSHQSLYHELVPWFNALYKSPVRCSSEHCHHDILTELLIHDAEVKKRNRWREFEIRVLITHN